MSGEIALWAARQDIKNHAAKMVLIALGDAFDDRTGLCFPSKEAIGDFVRREASSIKDAMRWLEDEGWIKRQARFDDKTKRQTSNSYEIIFTRGETFLAMLERRKKIRGEREKRVYENCTKEGAEASHPDQPENRPPPSRNPDQLRGTENRPPLTESLVNKGAPAREGDKSTGKGEPGIDWRNRLHLYRKRANWPLKWGPPMHKPGCLVPLHLVAKWDETKGEAFKHAEESAPKAAKRSWLPRGDGGVSNRPGTSHD